MPVAQSFTPALRIEVSPANRPIIEAVPGLGLREIADACSTCYPSHTRTLSVRRAIAVTAADRLYPTPVLWHLRQRHLLDGYLSAHNLDPAELGAALHRLMASPDGVAINRWAANGLEGLQLISSDPPPPRSALFPFAFVEAVNFELTYSCNLACTHCLQDGLRPSGPAIWPSTNTLLRVLEEARLLGLTRTGVNITGGEIFMAGSPVLELLAASAAQGIRSRANSNAWWGGRGPITIGQKHFADDAAVVAALRQCNLGRLALSLDRRYAQYPDLLDRFIRVATLCEHADQPYEVIATDPDKATTRLAEEKLHAALGHPPRFLLLTPMETVDIGAAALDESHSRTLVPDGLADLIHSAPCATAGFHRPYYLHIAPDGGLRSCLYAPAAGWLGSVHEQPLAALLNAAAHNPIVQLFASGDFEAFIARAITPWRHLYADPHHGCAASALMARIAEEVQRLERAAGRAAGDQELEELHRQIAAEYRLTPPPQGTAVSA